MPEALYQVRGLTKKYGSRTILDRLDFDILRGECLVILGRSGSGKSVTLRQLNGLEKPDAGTVTFDGIEISALEERELFPLRRRIAMLFQSGALFDSMNVLDNVAFPLREHTKLSAGGDRRHRAPEARPGGAQGRRAQGSRRTSPAACASASPWRARSPSTPRWCCSTSPPPASTP